MDFTLDETQQAVADLAASVLRQDDEKLWASMAQAGLLSLAVPTEFGGDGLGVAGVAVVLTEVGRQAAPVPAFATLALGVLPVVRLGSPAQQRSVFGGVADGQVLTGATRSIGPSSAETAGGSVRISGRWVGVPYAAQALRVLVPTALGIAMVDPHADGVELTSTASAAGSPECTVGLHDVVVPVSELLNCSGPAGGERELTRTATAGAAAVADGLLAGALALTSAHLGTRQQFGRPLATFQAVSQQIADVYVTSRAMQLAARSCCWQLDSGSGSDADDDLEIAAYWITAELPQAMQTCHHLHGGLGLDISYDLHRYYSQAKDLARFVGGREQCLETLGARCTSN